MRIILNKPAADVLTASLVAGIKRVGDAAEAVGRAAVEVQRVAEAPPARRWGTSAWQASAWADLLGRFTGR